MTFVPGKTGVVNAGDPFGTYFVARYCGINYSGTVNFPTVAANEGALYQTAAMAAWNAARYTVAPNPGNLDRWCTIAVRLGQIKVAAVTYPEVPFTMYSNPQLLGIP